MKQNNLNSKTILLIGSGRLATHLQHWNSLLEKPNILLTWDRSQDPRDLIQLLKQSNLVWLAISDSSIIPFFEKYLAVADLAIVHFSGALFDARLKSAHPLMSFPKTLLPKAIYQKISFAITGEDYFHNLMPGFPNPTFQIQSQDKPLYHALSVVAGNFPQLLWSEVDKKMVELNIPFEAYEIYLTQVLNNFLKLREKSMTGPLSRNDQDTMAKNEMALTDTKLKSIYQLFRKEFSL